MTEIRPADPSHYPAIADLMLAVNRATYGEQSSDYEGFVTDIEARAQESEMLVALDGERIVGAVAYVASPESPLAQNLEHNEVGMRMLAVDQTLARRGIGSTLVRACIDRARAAGSARLVLHADASHPPAVGLYHRLGFELDPGRDRLASDGTPLVCFTLDLA